MVRVRTASGMPVLRQVWPAAVAAGALIASGAYGMHHGAPPPLFTLLTALLTANVVLTICRRRVRPTNELWAVVGDKHVCMYRTTNIQVFGQVRRAVIRAREAQRP
ncbi:hypothetical protein GCM10009557_20220 [Virgisporangium ochraceum]|uniref:Uncharacterized protein n=1 Tax=Virgisporangium ochraceum TaxID=65505 RepID=A0A8J3ZKY5_9ACTN|nr:hypothetical protein Voc01_005730 [Virgisporangium ochraceum]